MNLTDAQQLANARAVIATLGLANNRLRGALNTCRLVALDGAQPAPAAISCTEIARIAALELETYDSLEVA